MLCSHYKQYYPMCHANGCNCFCRAMKRRPVFHARFTGFTICNMLCSHYKQYYPKCHANGCNCFCRAMKCRPVVHARFTLLFIGEVINDVTLWSIPIRAGVLGEFSQWSVPCEEYLHSAPINKSIIVHTASTVFIAY